MELQAKIEALLFFRGEPVSFKDLATDLKVEIEEIKNGIEELKNTLVGRGVEIVLHEDKVMLGTPRQMSEFFENLRKEELNKELSKAALETLSVVLYREGVTRGEINFIRGVNSSFILRNLEVRGLIERVTHKTDARMYVYKPSLELLSFLGVSSISELPQFEDIKKTLEAKLVGENQNDEENR